jgi:assimilatory nitrate reductase catalytic subunit
LRLTTGRLRDQWHGMSRTGRAALLYNHVEEPMVAMHAADMARRGLRNGDVAWLTSRRGRIALRVAASTEMYPGQLFVPMHFGARHLSHAGVNELTLAAFDPHSKQPELKHAAVQVEKAELPWQLFAVRLAPQGDAERALDWLDRLQPQLSRFSYAFAGLLGRDTPALALRIAHHEPMPQSWLGAIDAELEMPAEMCMSYNDPRRHVAKQVLIANAKVTGFRLCGDLAAGDWLREHLLEERPIDALRRWMLGPYTEPPVATGARSRGRIVCTCHDVATGEIETRIEAGASLDDLRAALKCGTNCGSCLPELKRMLAVVREVA